MVLRFFRGPDGWEATPSFLPRTCLGVSNESSGISSLRNQRKARLASSGTEAAEDAVAGLSRLEPEVSPQEAALPQGARDHIKRTANSKAKQEFAEFLAFLLLITLITTMGREGRSGLPGPPEPQGPKGDPEPPGQAFQIFRASDYRLRGEQLRNGDFEEWKGDKPLWWEGTNFERWEEANTGRYAVRLGAFPDKDAVLYQDVPIIPGCCFDLRFWLRMPEAVEQFRAEVNWLDREREILGNGVQLVFGNRPRQEYSWYSQLSGCAPPQAAWARVIFVKKGNGVADIDGVSLVGH